MILGHKPEPVSREAPTSGASAKPDNVVVFWILRDSVCGECGTELAKGRFLRMESDRPLCLHCADLDHLVFLPRGTTSLTRRASKHSTLRAVVVRFSRTRKRYERQGILVEEAALERAEQQCLADAEARAAARARAAERRRQLDATHVDAFARRISDLYPNCPRRERWAIAEHACRKYSGRVGRSAAAKQLDETAIQLAVRAHVRHWHTSYDEQLARGGERGEARAAVANAVEDVLTRWGPDRR